MIYGFIILIILLYLLLLSVTKWRKEKNYVMLLKSRELFINEFFLFCETNNKKMDEICLIKRMLDVVYPVDKQAMKFHFDDMAVQASALYKEITGDEFMDMNIPLRYSLEKFLDTGLKLEINESYTFKEEVLKSFNV